MPRLEVEAADFSLRDTLECGQAFRWVAKHGAQYGFIPARPAGNGAGGNHAAVRATQVESRLIIETLDAALSAEDVRRYFALDLDLPAILHSIDVDGQVHAAIERHRGLRVLRQDPWECLASFICSSFNNIKRIQGMIERLCQAYGSPVAFIPPPFAATNGGSAHSAGSNGSVKGGGINGFSGAGFPSPEAIAAAPERDLRALGLGFRAPYLRSTAKRIADGTLKFEQLRMVDYAGARTALMACDGVGEKVADCVALFGLEKYEAFPIDVWMARAMRYYFRRRKVTVKHMHTFAERQYGRYAGYAQQYLYHYVRTARVVKTAPVAREPVLYFG